MAKTTINLAKSPLPKALAAEALAALASRANSKLVIKNGSLGRRQNKAIRSKCTAKRGGGALTTMAENASLSDTKRKIASKRKND